MIDLSFRRLCMVLCAGFMICALGVAAFAYESPDPDRMGSIQITMRYNNQAVAGGSLTLYSVGRLAITDNQYGFVLADAFADSNLSIADIDAVSLPGDLFAYANKHSVNGVTQQIGADGAVSFEQLKPGLYLLVQGSAASGYQTADPFLVSLPMAENGTYVYDVDASPKVAVKQENRPSGKPMEPTISMITGSWLPQTGQLNWPIPVLAVSGLLLLCVGWFLYFGKRRAHEK